MNICVYCASRDQVSEQFRATARLLGEWIGRNGHTLVYGGATGGLMSEVSQAVRGSGGYIVGVVSQSVVELGRVSDVVDELLVVDNLNERKKLLKEYADVCVVLPGGFGTFDELFDTVASSMLKESDLCTILLNEDNYYEGIIKQIGRMAAEGLGYVRNSLLTTCNTLEECTTLLDEMDMKS